jgi:ATP synthase F1 complex assembly factor 2
LQVRELCAFIEERVLIVYTTALERATYTTKSFVIALALIRGRLNAEQAAQAAHAEVNSQIEKWGEVEDCECTSYRMLG